MVNSRMLQGEKERKAKEKEEQNRTNSLIEGHRKGEIEIKKSKKAKARDQ